MKTIMVTGATRGLGLALVRALDGYDDVALVLAVRDGAAGNELAATLRRPARVVVLDVGSLEQVGRFADAWHEPLWALVNNAGLQLVESTTTTAEGVEQTMAVNHLGPALLTLRLLPWLRGGQVVAIGSGTHNPEHPGATRFGFRGARYTSVDALARGESDGDSEKQRGMDRYATTKMLGMVFMSELARRTDATRFYTFDPGMMPGTSLARTSPWYGRLAWATVMRWLVPFLPDASTPERSGAALAEMLVRNDAASGGVFDLRGEPSGRVWAPALEPSLGRRVYEETASWFTTHGSAVPKT